MQTRDMYLHFTRSNISANGNNYNFSSRLKIRSFPMLFNGRTLIFTFSRTKIRIAEHERLYSPYYVYGFSTARARDYKAFWSSFSCSRGAHILESDLFRVEFCKSFITSGPGPGAGQMLSLGRHFLILSLSVLIE